MRDLFSYKGNIVAEFKYTAETGDPITNLRNR